MAFQGKLASGESLSSSKIRWRQRLAVNLLASVEPALRQSQTVLRSRRALPRLAGSAKSAGVEYEFKLAALVALRARAAGLRFELYSNARAACPFDDLVLRVLAPQPALYLVQLKHSANKKGVHLKDFAEEKYFSFFHDPLEFSKRQCPKPTQEEKGLLQEVRRPLTTLLLCTTGRLKRQEGARALPGRAEDAALEDLFAHRAPDAAPGGLLRLNHTDTEVGARLAPRLSALLSLSLLFSSFSPSFILTAFSPMSLRSSLFLFSFPLFFQPGNSSNASSVPQVWDRKQGQPEETSYKQFLSQLVLLAYRRNLSRNVTIN